MTTKLSPGTFFGQTRRRLEVAGLTFGESAYQAGLDIPVHVHANTFFYFVVEGSCEERCGQTTSICGQSTLVFHPAGEPHSNRWHAEGGLVLHMEISRERADTIRDQAPILDDHAAFRGGVMPWLAMRLYREYRRPDGASPLAMEGLALEILAEASRQEYLGPTRTTPGWLIRARELVHDRFAENLSLGEIAAIAGVHPGHLARAFRREYGCTLGDYVRRLRVEFACRQLASSDRPLVEIALAAGFTDQSHFTKTFRFQMQTTPAEYRRRHRAKLIPRGFRRYKNLAGAEP